MPLYVYEVVLADGSGGEQFEVFQKMADDPLAKHPETGKPVRRVYTEANAPARPGLTRRARPRSATRTSRRRGSPST